MQAILGKKIGMTSIFDEEGRMEPVTVVEAGPLTVMQVKTVKNEGYSAVQIGFGEKKMQRANKSELGHSKKADSSPRKYLREIKISEGEEASYKPGQAVSLAELGFEKGDFVDVSGISAGKGYQGVMKRHNFSGYSKTHGTHEYIRHGGSIGCSATPSRVVKGKKMAGQMGNEKVTVQNLQIVDVKAEENLILIRGALPGKKGGLVKISFAKKRPKKATAA